MCTVFIGSGGAFLKNTFSSTVQARYTDINASYHALQPRRRKRMSHGFTFLANYTYSKSLTTPFGEGVPVSTTGYSNAAVQRSEPPQDGLRTVELRPTRHVFTGSYVWHSPRVKSSGAFLRYLLDDYEIGAIVSAASGRPITVLQGTELSSTGIGQDRGTFISGVDPYSSNSCAGVTPSASVAHSRGLMTTAALKTNCGATFTPNCALPTFGNVAKNALRLPRTSNWDVQVSKYFNFSERWKLQIRAEYFNVLNHPNFAPESTSTGPVNGTDQNQRFRQDQWQCGIWHL